MEGNFFNCRYDIQIFLLSRCFINQEVGKIIVGDELMNNEAVI